VSAFATGVTAVVMGGFLVMTFVYLVIEDPSPVRIGTAGLALMAVFVLQVGVISNPERDPHRRTGVAALAGEVAIGALALEFGYGWLFICGFVAGNVLLVLRGRIRWPVFAAVCAVNLVATALLVADASPLLLGYATVQTAGTGLVVYGLTRLRQIAIELDGTRGAAGELAAAEERLRLARDLHGTTGHRLSAVALRAELALRLLGTAPERAVAEIARIVRDARAALAEVRATARRYRTPDLAHEVAAARSALDAAGVRTALHLEGPEVPPEAGAVLVSALRGAVDDVLGAGRVGHCRGVVGHRGDRVVLEMTDDRPPERRTDPDEDLVAAVEAAGGSCTAGSAAGGRWLQIEVPLPEDALETTPPDPPGTRRAPTGVGLPFAQSILVAVLVAYALNGVQFVLDAAPGAARTTVGIIAVCGVLALQLGVLGRRGGRPAWRYAALAAQAGLVVTSIAVVGDPYVGLPGLLAGSVLLVLPAWIRWPVFTALALAMGGVQAVLSGSTDGIAYGLVATVNHGLVVYGLTRLRDLVDALEAVRADVAALAVTRERLRFARDLHDLLGYGLSAITLKSELALRLATLDPARARAELDDVLGVAAQALADVRTVAGHQRPLDLAAEIASVRSVLDAAGIALELAPDPFPDVVALPTTPATVLATVLREAVTNLLRHSDATRCTIHLAVDEEAVRLEIVNDGVRTPARPPGSRPPGTGLPSLAARTASLGGVLTAGPDAADRFAVRVRLPAGCADHAGGGPAPSALTAAGSTGGPSAAM
jgi:signal transduction histidine kinase